MKKILFLKNPRGKSARKVRAAKTRKASVPAWIKAKGFASWSAYMASIRPNSQGETMAGTKKRKTRRRKNAPSATKRRRRHNAGGYQVISGRKRRRSSFRRNPPAVSVNGIVGMATQGAVDAAEVLAGKATVRLVRGKLGFQGNTTLGSIVELVAGIAGGIALRRFNPNAAKMFTAGAFTAPMETVIKQSRIPYLPEALGDEGDMPLISGYGLEDLAGYELQGGGSSQFGDARGISGYAMADN